MPYITRKRGGKYRVIERDTGKIAKNSAGTAIDGGGSADKAKVDKQTTAVNIAYARKHGAKIPKQRRKPS